MWTKLVASIEQMKPTVPNTRMGGNSFTGSMPSTAIAYEGDRGHEESDAQAVQDEQGSELDGRSGAHAVEAGPGHEEAGEAVAQGKDPLGFHFLVGDDAHQRGHENGDDALHGEEPLDLASETDVAQIASQGGEVGPPDGKLQEQHQNELEGYGFDFHLSVWFDYRFRIGLIFISVYGLIIVSGSQSHKNTKKSVTLTD